MSVSIPTLVSPSSLPLSPGHRMPSTNATAVRRISSDSLLEGGRELVIQHQGGEYHLRLTRNDKLILTK
ncbi:hemin uptake protein HemP [Frateuria defendens]|uniref:hemin uptake protein HemP n=1 Tax=Frateuria defendens TaxID=2219559 RepID=UPI00066FE72B